jgi:hypothetical protein
MIVRHFTRSILVQTLLVYVVLRAWITAGGLAMAEVAGAEPLPHPLFLSPLAALVLVLIVGAVGWVYLRRRNQDLLFANLGYGRGYTLALLFGPITLSEALLAVVARL